MKKYNIIILIGFLCSCTNNPVNDGNIINKNNTISATCSYYDLFGDFNYWNVLRFKWESKGMNCRYFLKGNIAIDTNSAILPSKYIASTSDTLLTIYNLERNINYIFQIYSITNSNDTIRSNIINIYPQSPKKYIAEKWYYTLYIDTSLYLLSIVIPHYNTNNRIISKTLFDIDSGDTVRTQNQYMKYDSLGLLKQIYTDSTLEWEYQYDDFGRKIKEIYSGVDTISNQYDSSGLLIKSTEWQVNTFYQYAFDNYGCIIKEYRNNNLVANYYYNSYCEIIRGEYLSNGNIFKKDEYIYSPDLSFIEGDSYPLGTDGFYHYNKLIREY